MHSRRRKCRSTSAVPPVAFRAFGDVRPLLCRYVLPVHGRSGSPPREIVCDTRDATLALREQIKEADVDEFEAALNPP